MIEVAAELAVCLIREARVVKSPDTGQLAALAAPCSRFHLIKTLIK
jgi:hypothetical protein